tara:strand:- start:30851 stop:31339 length:489 start_codon:yes stop_codon:yes gene_type:complete
MNSLEQLLNKFGKNTIKQSRSNLTRLKKISSGELYDSLSYEIQETADGYTIGFSMQEYGIFVDEGVSGTKNKYDTPNSYTNKQPPQSAILPWIKAKGLRLRDESGKFKKGGVKTLSFLIARSIKENGMKPTKFFTKPFENEFNKLPDEVLENFLKDFFINKA